MSDIRDSDTIPTEQDKQNAAEMFGDSDGNMDNVKIANTIARLHRKGTQYQKTMSELSTQVDDLDTSVATLAREFKSHRTETADIKTSLVGDALGQSRGLITEHKEQGAKIDDILAIVSGKDATTKKTRKPSGEDEYKKFVYMGIGVIAFVGWLVPIIVSIFNG